ncbi:GntR family transcriptional regulator [Methylobacterium sp. EM32]|uniref:GntR family transcriptional regulator n=1 Tax=Methylobacterium sp. EM32 TaxID=3163481 RepID=UPI0033B198CF
MIAGALGMLAPPQLVRERAFEEVRDAIIAGRIAPGARLIERELCAALGISRASVREMIRRLEAERLVSVEPRKGPTVMALTAKDAAEIYEIRALLEALLIERFTAVASEDEIAHLEGLFAQVRTAAATDAVSEIVGLMLRFNDHLLVVVGHEVARDLLRQLNARINFLRIRAMAKPGRIAASLEEIGAILDAVRRRDGARAGALMRASVEHARDAALEQLASQEPDRPAGRRRGAAAPRRSADRREAP